METKYKSQRIKKSSNVKSKQLSNLQEEIQHLHESIEDLHDDIKKMVPKSVGRRALNYLFMGIIKGLGIVIGTTIVAGLLFFTIQKVFKTSSVQDWISNKIQTSVENTVKKSLPDGINIPSLN